MEAETTTGEQYQQNVGIWEVDGWAVMDLAERRKLQAFTVGKEVNKKQHDSYYSSLERIKY